MALLADFYNQISKYCCGESSGNNEGWIRIDSNQEIERTGYARINFKMSKGYTPSSITIKPSGGSTPDSLNHLTHSCSPRGDYQTCYYKFKDFSLSSTDTRQRRVTITAEKDGDSSKKISAQATIPVERVWGMLAEEKISITAELTRLIIPHQDTANQKEMIGQKMINIPS